MRKTIPVEKRIYLNYGTDHALGQWAEVIDDDIAEAEENSEPYLFEYSEKFGLTFNKIGVEEADFLNSEKILELTKKYLTPKVSETNWYHFKKTRFGPSAETYMQVFAETEEEIQEICKEWATNVNSAGANTSFSYSFDKVDFPPEEWIFKSISGVEAAITRLKLKHNFFTNLLKEKNETN